MASKAFLVAALVAAGVVAGAGGGAATTAPMPIHGNGAIAFGNGGSLLVVDPGRPGQVRELASCPQGSACEIDEPAWSPGGKRLAFVQGAFAVNHPSHMFLYVTANGGGPRELASCGSCGRAGGWLDWSPNGKWIVFSRDGFRTGEDPLWIVRAAGGKPRRLTQCHRRCDDLNPSWSPNGRLLVYEHIAGGSTSLYTVRPNGSDPDKMTLGEDPQWSPDGSRIVFEDARGIEVANADGSGVRMLYPQTGGRGPGVPSWSPDGNKLVFFNTPGGPNHYTAEVWTMNGDGTDQQRLYHSGCCVGDWAAPIWSPDGRTIAFSADSAGGMFVINADGSGLRQLNPNQSFYGPSSMSWQPLNVRVF